MEVDVFKRTETDDEIISASTYNFVIGLTLIWGFFVNWLMVQSISPESISSVNPIIFFIGYFASCFFGIYLFKKSNSPVVSFVGYNFVVVPFGLIINLVVSQYNPDIVLEAIRVTGLVTFVMMLLGSMYPAFFNKIIGGLTVALISVIVVELIMVFIFNTHHGILN